MMLLVKELNYNMLNIVVACLKNNPRLIYYNSIVQYRLDY